MHSRVENTIPEWLPGIQERNNESDFRLPQKLNGNTPLAVAVHSSVSMGWLLPEEQERLPVGKL
jgi:hypothetical protein